MSLYADVALPAAVHKQFTYEVPQSLQNDVAEGKRVWMPFRNYYAIGLIVRVHDQKPSFKTRPIKKVLDEEPVFSEELLNLTQWVAKFYFCGWGEAIQAALPTGLNFVSKKYLILSDNTEIAKYSAEEQEILEDLDDGSMTQNEARRKWSQGKGKGVLNRLIKSGVIEIWEKPEMNTSVPMQTMIDWNGEGRREEAELFLQSEESNTDLKWVGALERLLSVELPKERSELTQKEWFTAYVRNKLSEEGWIQEYEVEKSVIPASAVYDPGSMNPLNEEQSNIYDTIAQKIEAESFANFLLFGITGSGKTEVYIHALKKTLEKGKGGIVLVPEIALTPQTVSRFYRVFGDNVAILHSRLSTGERLKAWKDLQSGEKKIVIGPRSAVFAPVQNPGIIILDEEHDSSYKQFDPAPRYHARETAIMRAHLNDAVVIMGSATPSMQALHMVTKKKAELLELKKRHAEAVLPEVKVLDLKSYRHAMKGNLTVGLHKAMGEALAKDEQVILLLNRRGFGNYLQCESCGHIPQSPACSVSLTYHKHRNILLCHYSGYSRKKDTHCEKCGSPELRIMGSGTQKIEEELADFFPDNKVLRFDRDSTGGKYAHERILQQFADQEAQILIGTQLVAKGLDFPNVTVVGVINADTELAFPSFQSSERMYQLLSQVSGRSGRGEKPGKVYIQTWDPEHNAIEFAKEHDYKGFAKTEMAYRKTLDYPPYSRLIRFELKGKKETEVEKASAFLRSVIETVHPNAEIMGPSPSTIGYRNNQFFWELSVKADASKGANYIYAWNKQVMEVYEGNRTGNFGSVRININVDAIQ